MSLDDFVFEKLKAPKKGGAKAQDSGKAAQKIINGTNDRYEDQGRAYVREVSVNFQIEQFGTQGRATGRVRKGPVDYLGVWMGKAIAFDVKSCDAQRFPLKNVEDHQLTFLNKWIKQQGIGFFLVRMVAFEVWYVVPYSAMVKAWREADHGEGPKSLPIDWFIEHGYPVTQRPGMVDYLAVVRDHTERFVHA